MPIHIGTSNKNQQQIAFGLTQMQKVYVGDKLVWQKILASVGGYGMLYNWPCTQEQAVVENGRLYNFYAATDSRNICSVGFHVPTNTEFATLETYIGGTAIGGGKLKETGTTHWNSPNVNATNDYGFNLRGSGNRISGSFSTLKAVSELWSSSAYNSTYGWMRRYYGANATILVNAETKRNGFGIRPIKDSTTLTNGQTGTYVDPSGIIYPTICIGTQEWVACNLMTKHYRNGDAIPEVTDNTAWAALTMGARCSYNNTESNAGSTKKLSSSDEWVVPTYSNWASLSTFLGGDLVSGLKIKEIGTTHWITSNGTNDVSFNAAGCGYRKNDGDFDMLKSAYLMQLSDAGGWNPMGGVILFDTDGSIGYGTGANAGKSIRLLYAGSGTPTTYTGNDGTVYPVVKIGTQYWLAQNLKETKWSDGTDIQNITDNTAWSLLKEAACCDINNDPTKR